MQYKPGLRTCAMIAILFMLLTVTPTCRAEKGIQWHSYEEGIKKAKETQKLIFINFHADWCTFCKKMEKESFTDPKIIASLNEHFVSIHIDTEKERSLAQKFFIRSLPTIWFLEHDQEKITNVPGYIPPDIFLKILEWLHTGVYKEMNFKDFMGKGKK